MANEEWCDILLGGNKRWQQKVAVNLSPGFVGYTVLESYLIKNEDTDSTACGNQELHCDLTAGIEGIDMSDSKANDKVRDTVLIAMGPADETPVHIMLWDTHQQTQQRITVTPGQCLIFCATRCWHAGYGGQQGTRLHTMIMPSNEYRQHHKDILMEAEKSLTVSSVQNPDALVWEYVKSS